MKCQRYRIHGIQSVPEARTRRSITDEESPFLSYSTSHFMRLLTVCTVRAGCFSSETADRALPPGMWICIMLLKEICTLSSTGSAYGIVLSSAILLPDSIFRVSKTKDTVKVLLNLPPEALIHASFILFLCLPLISFSFLIFFDGSLHASASSLCSLRTLRSHSSSSPLERFSTHVDI